MSELVLSWDLTPTERRIAETAFARSNIDFDPQARAYDAVIAVRSLRGDIRDRQVSLMEREQMLAELRSEPESVLDEDMAIRWKLRRERNEALAERDRLRVLLERIVAANDELPDDIAVGSGMDEAYDAQERAIEAAREELGR